MSRMAGGKLQPSRHADQPNVGNPKVSSWRFTRSDRRMFGALRCESLSDGIKAQDGHAHRSVLPTRCSSGAVAPMPDRKGQPRANDELVSKISAPQCNDLDQPHKLRAGPCRTSRAFDQNPILTSNSNIKPLMDDLTTILGPLIRMRHCPLLISLRGDKSTSTTWSEMARIQCQNPSAYVLATAPAAPCASHGIGLINPVENRLPAAFIWSKGRR
jgi:hypothetical protein